MSVTALHHVCLIVSDLRRSVEFYEKNLGLRRVKRTVMPEDPSVAQVYLGTPDGPAGSLICLSALPGATGGRCGIGGVHHVAFRVSTESALLRWKRWFSDRGLKVAGPFDRRYFQAVSVRDPDGAIIEIATDGPGFGVDGEAVDYMDPPNAYLRPFRDDEACRSRTWPEPVTQIDASMRLTGLHHITAIASDLHRSQDFYAGVLGLYLVKRTRRFDDSTAEQNYFGDPEGRPGTVISFFGYPPEKMRTAERGAGHLCHLACQVSREEDLEALAGRLVQVGARPSPIRDCTYFRAVTFRDPDGLPLMAATPTPGFGCDEPPEALGSRLCLPAWLEPRREQIEGRCRLD